MLFYFLQLPKIKSRLPPCLKFVLFIISERCTYFLIKILFKVYNKQLSNHYSYKQKIDIKLFPILT